MTTTAIFLKQNPIPRIPTLACVCFLLAVSTALANDTLDAPTLPASWQAHPTWLGNSSPTASVTRDGGALCFQVDEPGRGMKWSAPLPLTPLDERPFLVLRYRAENLATTSEDYLIYLDDGQSSKQLNAFRLMDAVADGQWHLLTVDLSTLTAAEAVSGLAVQVQATAQGHSRLWIDRVEFAEEPPPGSQMIQRTPVVPPRPDWIAPMEKSEWTAQTSWLPDPAAHGQEKVSRLDGATLFRVSAPGKGMKWSWNLPEPVSLAGHRYAAVRYRARDLAPDWDYAICVLGKAQGIGPDNLSLIGSSELMSDGQWHVLNLDLRRAAAKIEPMTALAVQVQAAGPGASLELSDLRFVNTIQPSRMADALSLSEGALFRDFQSIVIPVNDDANSWRRKLHLADWFANSRFSAEGIPFSLPVEKPGLAATGLTAKEELRIPCHVSASEVYLLMLAAFSGPDEAVYGSGKLLAIRDVDRFRLRLEYADGTADECLPINGATRQFGIVSGPQVAVAAVDRSKVLKAIVLCDRTRQGAFAVAAITARTTGQPLFPETRENTAPIRLKHVIGSNQAARVEQAGSRFTVLTDKLTAVLRTDHLPVVEHLIHRATKWDYLAAPCPLVGISVDGKQLLAADFEWKPGSKFEYRSQTIPGLEAKVAISAAAEGGLSISLMVTNRGAASHRVTLSVPALGPYRLCDRAEEAFYLLPRRGAIFGNQPCDYHERYCGTFPLQFLDTFSPSSGRGLTLRTADTECRWKGYRLRKEGSTFTVGVEYPEQTLKPGESFQTPRAVISATDGDWHRGLEAYRRWLAAWYKPVSPRQHWFREVFNFRQSFLWGQDSLYDAQTGTFHLDRAIEEARREFGGMDYLHLFDWGNCGKYGRIYGRTGDYSPYDYLTGGRDAFRSAIAAIRKQGVPVGLYIEGYLLDERGKLGQQFGKQWQMIGADGKGRYWPDSTEMYACSFDPAWREVQASTFATKVKELDVDGMYLDEYGFAGASVDCWAKDHNHDRPGYAVVGERDCTKLVRERISGTKPGVVLYSEESPVDVTSQFQDGSFTYAMSESRFAPTTVPLNLIRFAIPDFKTIEILYCDKPTGSWATGVYRVFFNGEAIWLQGTAADWFEPETRAAIRRCYRILHQYRDAFTSLDPTPLEPTEMGGVFANKFPAKTRTVYTLYNSRHRTVRGEVLRVPYHSGAIYYDEWRQRPAPTRREGKDVIISTEIDPQGVGCLVMSDVPLTHRVPEGQHE